MSSVLWVGDAVLQTGFARVTHNVLDYLHSIGWTVNLIGINYDGDPNHGYPYAIWPAGTGGDQLGRKRLATLSQHLKPDVICIIQDPWVVADYLNSDVSPTIPIVAYMPVDGKNISKAPLLNDLACAIWYTNFGKKEATIGGYEGKSEVIPHGVDLAVYSPGDRDEARRNLGLDVALATQGIDYQDAFIAMNINRNQPRKRLDYALHVFAKWWNAEGRPDNAFLYLHCAAVDLGYDIKQLARYYGIGKRVILSRVKYSSRDSVSEADLANIYRAGDIGFSTTRGEGWGLTTMEGMACGLGQILPDWAALGEWPRDFAYMVPVSHVLTEVRVNIIGAMASSKHMVDALHIAFTSPEWRREYSRKALACVANPAYRWESVAQEFHRVLTEVVNGEHKQRSEEPDTLVDTRIEAARAAGEQADDRDGVEASS
jgi:glycosyltransferase involved in cell wall biosynthesis